jgi:hypothetical protein
MTERFEAAVRALGALRAAEQAAESALQQFERNRDRGSAAVTREAIKALRAARDEVMKAVRELAD